MEFRKNDILTLDIEDCGVDGEGIGKADGFTVFVKDAVIGDRIKAKIIPMMVPIRSDQPTIYNVCPPFNIRRSTVTLKIFVFMSSSILLHLQPFS